ncbi:MAG: hypothetical protein NVS3B10_20810 [Polyangiales bacterium]
MLRAAMAIDAAWRRMAMNRRQALASLLGLAAAGAIGGCGSGGAPESSLPALPTETPDRPLADPPPFVDNVDALYDVLLPAERDGAV